MQNTVDSHHLRFNNPPLMTTRKKLATHLAEVILVNFPPYFYELLHSLVHLSFSKKYNSIIEYGIEILKVYMIISIKNINKISTFFYLHILYCVPCRRFARHLSHGIIKVTDSYICVHSSPFTSSQLGLSLLFCTDSRRSLPCPRYVQWNFLITNAVSLRESTLTVLAQG